MLIVLEKGLLGLYCSACKKALNIVCKRRFSGTFTCKIEKEKASHGL